MVSHYSHSLQALRWIAIGACAYAISKFDAFAHHQYAAQLCSGNWQCVPRGLHFMRESKCPLSASPGRDRGSVRNA
eukprot:54832-Amphidinium_carterae.1